MADIRDKLIELLAKYFTIGDSYAYNLTRVKEAFAVGTVTIDDFVEFDDDTIADIADYLLADKEISRAFELLQVEREGRLILPPCKVGDTVWKITGPNEIEKRVVLDFIYDGELYVCLRPFTSYWYSFGKTVFLTREEAEKALREKEK